MFILITMQDGQQYRTTVKAVEGKFTEWEETLIISMNQGYRFFDLAWYDEEAGEKD